ncbi:MAG: hypothetical protein AB8B99_03000 [Phormidesmis sp.]
MALIENPVSEPIVFPDWGAFKLAMLSDAAYQRVSGSAAEIWRTRAETFFAIQGEELGEVVQLWGAMLTSCPEEQRPTQAEAARWAEIAEGAEMPITFDEKGFLKPHET